MKSSGGGASNVTHSFVLGWKTPSFHAWNICSSTVAPRPADGTLDVTDGFVSPGRRARDDNGVPIDPDTWKIDWQQTGKGACGPCQGAAAGSSAMIQCLASSLVILPLVLVVLGPLAVAGPGWRAPALLHVTRRDLVIGYRRTSHFVFR